jgi:nitrogenase subunit NifH
MTGNESKDKVVEKLKEFEKIVLFHVTDPSTNLDTTRTGTKIKEAETIIDTLKKKLKGKKIKEVMMWGNSLNKITNTAKLEKIKDIMLVDTQRMKKDLEEKFNVVVIRT